MNTQQAGSSRHRRPGAACTGAASRLEGPITMLAIIGAVLFVIAFILNAASVGDSPLFTPFSLMLLGLACLAAHLAGWGTSTNWRTSWGRRRRR
jgi:hypothetical protein